MTREEAELMLIEWAASRDSRDSLVRAAVSAGISKHRVYVLTGIARTTIDDILRSDGPHGHADGPELS